MKFIDRLKELLGPQEIKDLAEYGCQQLGPAGLCHYNETMAIYDEDGIAEEIWSALYDEVLEDGQVFTNGLGCVRFSKDGALIGVNMLAYLASYGSHDRGGSGAWNVASRASFENMLVWWMADRTAREIATVDFVRMVNVFAMECDSHLVEDVTWDMLPEPFGTLEVKTAPLAPGEEDNAKYRLRDGTRTGCKVLYENDLPTEADIHRY